MQILFFGEQMPGPLVQRGLPQRGWGIVNNELQILICRHSDARPPCVKGAPATRVGDCFNAWLYNPSVTHSRATSLCTREAFSPVDSWLNSSLDPNLPFHLPCSPDHPPCLKGFEGVKGKSFFKSFPLALPLASPRKENGYEITALRRYLPHGKD